MLAVVKRRPKLKRFIQEMSEISRLAESCARQLGAWMGSIEDSPVKGKRLLDANARQARQVKYAAEEYRLRFLRSLSPEHPLYGSEDARAARKSSQGAQP
jgi:hypothetical protein